MKLQVIFLFLFALLIQVRPSLAQCSISEQIDIPDLSPVTANFIVEGSTNPDLSGTQGVCGIYLEFEHQQVGDLTIDLTSPSGQSITLMGPSGSFGNTSFTDWEVLFVPCGSAGSPDVGFSETWNNDQPWGILGEYSGSYHPYLGCLEDFDQGTINGIWSLQILDNALFDLGVLKDATIFFCDESGLDCNICEADPGEFVSNEISICIPESDSIDLIPSFQNGQPSDDYQFLYVIRQGETIFDIDEAIDMTSFAAGAYEVCGFSLHLDDIDSIPILETGTFDDLVTSVESMNPTICGSINQDCVTLLLQEPPETVILDVTICDGGDYEFGGIVYSAADQYEIVRPQSNGCDSIYILNLETANLEAVISANSNVLSCADSQLLLTGSDSETTNSSLFQWTTIGGGFVGPTDEETAIVNQAGIYILTITDGQCVSTDSIQILVDANTPSIVLTGGTLTCVNSSVEIDFSSTSIIQTFSWLGPNGFTSNMEDIEVDFPGIYTVTVEATNGCIASESVVINQAGDVPILQLSAETISCSQPQIIIDVDATSNALSYEWNGPNGFTFSGKNPIVSEAGTYFVSATDAFGCVGNYSIELTGTSDELDYNLNFEDILCPNESAMVSIAIADPNAFVEWTLPNNDILSGTSIFTELTGMHYVSIISEGCQAVDSFNVEENFINLPNVAPFQSDIIDCNNPNTTVFLNPIDNQAFIDSVEWFGPNGFISNVEDIVVEVSGTYSAFVYSEEGCTQIFDYFLEFDTEVPSINDTIFPLTCLNDNPRIITTASSDFTYSWIGPSGFTSSDSIVENLTPGEYSLTVADENNCSRQYYYLVTVDTLPINLDLSVDNELNCIVDSVEIQSSSVSISNILWTSSTGYTSSDLIAHVDEPGMYYLMAEGIENGCISNDSIEVVQDLDIPDLFIEDQSFSCGQNSLILQASSSSSNDIYAWTGPSGFISSLPAPLISEQGQYAVTVTSLNGCINSGTINVSQDNSLPEISVSYSNDLDCVNTQAILTGSTTTSNVTFIWKGPNNIFDDPVITVDIPGDYTFIVTGQNGCSDSITLNVPFTGSYPDFEAIGDTLVCGEVETSIDVLEITPGVDYSWTGPGGFSSTSNFNAAVEPGEYILTGVATNSCISRDTAFVFIDTVAAILDFLILPDTLTCTQESTQIEISSDKDLISSNWTGPLGFADSLLSITLSNPGIYIFSGISENDCITNWQIEVFQDIDAPVFSLVADTLDCNNEQSSILLTNNDVESTYNWEGPSFTSNLQSPIVEDEGMYLVTVTGGNGCVKTDSVEVLEDFVIPDLVVFNDTLPCDGSAIELSAITMTDGATFSWMGPNGFDSIGPSPLTDLAGTYFVQVVGPNGCSTEEMVEIADVPTKPTFDIAKSSDINCEFLSISLQGVSIEDDESVIWTGPNNLVSEADSIVTFEAGTYFLQVLGVNGCSGIDSIEVNVDTLAPTVELEQIGRILCDVNNVSISGLGSSEGDEFIYNWSTNDGIINFGDDSLEPEIEGVGTYTLVIQNSENQCINRDSIEIEVEESTLESIITAVDKQTCQGFEDGVIEVLDVNGGVEPYRYAFEGSSFTELGYFDELTSNVYNLTVKDSFGCVLDTAIWLGLERSVKVDLGNDTLVDLGENVNLQAVLSIPKNEIVDVEWDPSGIIDCNNCLEFQFVPPTNMVVRIEIVDIEGCTAEDQVIIRVKEDINLYIPNTFTPNNDGVNDVFSISTSRNVEKVLFFDIYDRWGSKVFSDTDFVPGEGLSWDGRHLGQKVQEGAFVYLAKLQMVNGEIEVIRGDITVIR